MSVKPKKNKVEKDIKKAVDKIPGLIFEQVEFNSSTKKIKKDKNKEIPKTPPTKNMDQEKKKRGLMWLGVIILAIIILAMWSWNTFVNFDTLSKKEKETIMDQIKESFEKTKQQTEIFESPINTTTEEKLDDEAIKLKITNSLTTLINELSSTTTSTIYSTTSLDTGINPNFPTSSPEVIISL